MFNIGPQELLLILLVALIVVGPKRLPELSRSIGKGLRELRKAQDEVRKTIDLSLDESEPTAPSPRSAPASAAPEGAATERAPGAPVSPPATEETESIARTLGRGLAEIRRTRQEVQRSFRVDVPEGRSSPTPRSRPARPVTEPPEPVEAAPPGPTGDEVADPAPPGGSGQTE